MIVLLGPTAAGKTKVAAHLAAKISAEIISADSRQVYKDMNIGTGKDLGDYIVEGKTVPYHLINIKKATTLLFQLKDSNLTWVQNTHRMCRIGAGPLLPLVLRLQSIFRFCKNFHWPFV